MNKRPININDKFGDYTIISEPYKINNALFVNITKTYFSQIKLNANKRKLKFNLNINFLDKLLESQNFKCYLSNQKISVHERTASLDRINSSLDYTKNNVAWIHKDIQRMKSDFSLEYFINICTKIANNHNPILDLK